MTPPGGAVLEIPTPRGPARATVHPADPALPRTGRKATLVLGHGAGGGIEARDLVALAGALPSRGVTVVLVEQPWRVAGRTIAGPPPQLDEAWLAVLAVVDGLPSREGLLVAGGRSAGARVACRTASAVRADAVLALAFPLHPPGRPDRSRAEELAGVRIPVLVVQGERDPFGGPAELPPGTPVAAIPYADHGFAVPRRAPLSQDAALALLVSAVDGFLGTLPGPALGSAPGSAR